MPTHKLTQIKEDMASRRRRWQKQWEQTQKMLKTFPFRLIDNVLYKTESDGRKRFAVPTVCREQVMKDGHSHVHHGVPRTFRAVSKEHWWPGMKYDIHDFVKRCDTCQRIKNPNAREKAKALLQSIPTTAPYQMVALDIAGPIRPPGSNHERYILVITDLFTKWVELVPISNRTMPTVIDALIDRWFFRFGYPKEILTDRAREFHNKFVEALLENMNVRKLATSGYRPQCNGQAERVNRTVIKMLRSYIDRNNAKSWVSKLPAIQFAYNTSVNASTGVSPFYAIYGTEAPTLEKLSFDAPTGYKDVRAYAESVKARVDIARDKMVERLEKAQQAQADIYDLFADDINLPVPSSVMQRVGQQKKGISKKLSFLWEGPYEVIKRVSAVTYLVRAPGKKRAPWICHIDRLKPYYSPSVPDIKFRREKGTPVLAKDDEATDAEIFDFTNIEPKVKSKRKDKPTRAGPRRGSKFTKSHNQTTKGSSSNSPDSSRSKPDTTMSIPDSSRSIPDSSRSKPDTTMSFPDSSRSNSDNAVRSTTLQHVTTNPQHADDNLPRLQVTCSPSKRQVQVVTDTNISVSVSSTGKRSASTVTASNLSGKKNKPNANTITSTDTLSSSVTGLPVPAQTTPVSSINDSKPAESVPRMFSVFSKKSYPQEFIKEFDAVNFRAVTDYVAEQNTDDGFYYWCVFQNQPSGFVTLDQLPDYAQRLLINATVKGLPGYKAYVKKMQKKHPDLF
jgi:transposase InsO family protein